MIERRSEARAVTGLSGTLTTGRGVMTACTVANLSPGGAEVSPSGEARLPDRFAVSLGHGAPALPARVVWRQGRRIGVAFDERRDVPPVIDA